MCRLGSASTLRSVGLLLLLLGLLLGAAGCVEPPDARLSLDTYRQRLNAIDDKSFYQTAYVVDRNGELLAEISPDGHRTWVALTDMAPVLRQAVVDTEDRSFYSNEGVDTSAVARALLQNAHAGENVSGASTITMQLVRLVAFDADERYEQSLERKVREAHLAAEVAEEYSKDEILEAYLNIAYFGHGAYGAEAAAQTYFGVPASQLTTPQATLLAGVLQAPSILDPFTSLAAARKRQRVVLASMVEMGHLTAAQSESVWGAPLGFAKEPAPTARRAEHFVDYVLAELPQRLGAVVAAQGGYTVTSTIDLAYNERLRAIAAQHVEGLRAAHDLTEAAVVALRPRTGEIIAMVGGTDYAEPKAGQVNVTTSPRQIGSAFKPITYAAALEAGWTPADVLWDIPLTFGEGAGAYKPENYDGRYRGAVRLRYGLADSLNAASVGLLADVGLEDVYTLATAMGLELGTDPWAYGLSLTLGGAEVRLLDVTGAYAAFAAGGQHADPTGVLAVTRIRDGKEIYRLAPRTHQVVSPQTAYLISNILSDADARSQAFGRGGPLETSRPSAVKTGTTNDFRDNLTIGYTPYLAIGVWAGNKDGHPMRDVLGVTGAAPIWHDSMEELFRSEELLVALGDGQFPPFDFAEPEGIVRADVCDLASVAQGSECSPRQEAFASGGRVGDPGTAFDFFALRTPAADGDPCAVRDPGGQLMLLPPHRQDLADQVRKWAAANGVKVAPPSCQGAAGESGSALAGAATSREAAGRTQP